MELFDDIFWPRDILPNKIPNARIITWGYDVKINSMFRSSNSILDHSDTLLADLVAERSSEDGKRKPLIFVAHSLGGIVVKDALSLSKQETTSFKEILPATIGVAFLGTPHHGSKAATLGKLAFELSRLFFQKPNLEALRTLERNSELLERISRSFGHVLASGHIKVHSFHEEPERRYMSIVDSSSSTIGYLHESRSSLHANHRNMAKFSCANDINFKRVLAVLQSWIADLNSTKLATDKPILNLNITKGPDSIIFDNVYEQCLHDLEVPETRMRFEDIELPYPDTYSWLYDNELGFKRWLEGAIEAPMFWISGKPGSGKSTLMKYALTHKTTAECLRRCNNSFWLITGYFFHDRGTEMQKSIQGFLCEVLYQILRAYPASFSIVQSEYTQLVQSEVQSKKHRWSIERLRRALLAIGAESNVVFNCCLFVDALDEQEGKHRDLVMILKELAQSSHNSMFRLRLCLAGRPENIFRGAFGTLPGFAIQDYTASDIRHYAEDRIRREYFAALDDRRSQDTRQLVSEVERKADGAFLWVRLVINETIAGLEDGESFKNMLTTLSEIPTELSELYSRAVRRVRLAHDDSASVRERKRLETYIVLQIASCAKEPIPLGIFISAVYHNSPLSKSDDERARSQDEMRRYLNSRSAGLLESKKRYGGSSYVQFIHQTVKEFITSEKGQETIKENVEAPGDLCPFREGSTYIFRYISTSFRPYSSPRVPNGWNFQNFVTYARDLEYRERPVFWEMKADWWPFHQPQTEGLFRAVGHDESSDWLEQAQILSSVWPMFFLLCDLPLSLAACLIEFEQDAKVFDLLFEAALSPKCTSDSCFGILLQAGSAKEMSKEAFTRLDEKLLVRLGEIDGVQTCKIPTTERKREWSWSKRGGKLLTS